MWESSSERKREKEGVRLRRAAEKSRRGMWERGVRDGVKVLWKGVDWLGGCAERRLSTSSGDAEGGACEREKVPAVAERRGKGEARKVDMVSERSTSLGKHVGKRVR